MARAGALDRRACYHRRGHRRRVDVDVIQVPGAGNSTVPSAGALRFEEEAKMKVKTFVGNDAEEVDKKVNDWLAESKVRVSRTSTAFKRLRFLGGGKLAGAPVVRHGVGIAISVWYERDVAERRAKPGRFGKLGRDSRKLVR
jgi:hypothetical protein